MAGICGEAGCGHLDILDAVDRRFGNAAEDFVELILLARFAECDFDGFFGICAGNHGYFRRSGVAVFIFLHVEVKVGIVVGRTDVFSGAGGDIAAFVGPDVDRSIVLGNINGVFTCLKFIFINLRICAFVLNFDIGRVVDVELDGIIFVFHDVERHFHITGHGDLHVGTGAKLRFTAVDGVVDELIVVGCNDSYESAHFHAEFRLNLGHGFGTAFVADNRDSGHNLAEIGCEGFGKLDGECAVLFGERGDDFELTAVLGVDRVGVASVFGNGVNVLAVEDDFVENIAVCVDRAHDSKRGVEAGDEVYGVLAGVEGEIFVVGRLKLNVGFFRLVDGEFEGVFLTLFLLVARS